MDAPLNSPPPKKPWASRSSSNRIGAATPIDAYDGSRPMTAVATPMSSTGQGEHRPPADAVAQPAQQNAAERAQQERHAEDRQRAEERDGTVALGEEDLRDDRGAVAVDGEVVPLDEVPDRRRDERLPCHVGLCVLWRRGHAHSLLSESGWRP
nr:hypothetical protein [Nonomuraea terrae]